MPDYENSTMSGTEWAAASLLERVAELEDAIAPFARVAGWFEHQRPAHSIITTGNGDVTVDDLLAARAVLARALTRHPLRRLAHRGTEPALGTWERPEA